MYRRQPTHLAPEATRFNPQGGQGQDMSAWNNAGQYLLRPEAAEAIFYMFYYTGDPKYRRWAGEMMEAIERNCRAAYGYSAWISGDYQGRRISFRGAVRKASVESDDGASTERKFLTRSMDFRSGVEAHLKRVLKNLKTEESTLNKKVKKPSKRRTLDPKTPDMRVTVDPLQHLASPMTPLALSELSELSDVEAVGTNVPSIPRSCRRPVLNRVNRVNGPTETPVDHIDLTVEQLVTLSDTEDVD
eukprot:symbB.v1.2.002249.t1/scaffold92.1/size545918/6